MSSCHKVNCYTSSHGCIRPGCKKTRWEKQPGAESTMQSIWQPKNNALSRFRGERDREDRAEWQGGASSVMWNAIDFYGTRSKSIKWCWARTNRKGIILTASHSKDCVEWHETHAENEFKMWISVKQALKTINSLYFSLYCHSSATFQTFFNICNPWWLSNTLYFLQITVGKPSVF